MNNIFSRILSPTDWALSAARHHRSFHYYYYYFRISIAISTWSTRSTNAKIVIHRIAWNVRVFIYIYDGKSLLLCIAVWAHPFQFDFVINVCIFPFVCLFVCAWIGCWWSYDGQNKITVFIVWHVRFRVHTLLHLHSHASGSFSIRQWAVILITYIYVELMNARIGCVFLCERLQPFCTIHSI